MSGPLYLMFLPTPPFPLTMLHSRLLLWCFVQILESVDMMLNGPESV